MAVVHHPPAKALLLLLSLGATPGISRGSKRIKTCIIGIDGASGSTVKKIVDDSDTFVTSTFRDLRDAGAMHLFEGSPAERPSYSGPGWSSILTGVRMHKHGVTNNAFTGKKLNKYPDLFKYISVPSRSLAHWKPIHDHITKHATSSEWINSDLQLKSAAVADVSRDAYDAFFFHFLDVDNAGHAHGRTSSNYMSALRRIEGYVGEIWGAIRARPTYSDEDWLLILTADHGHTAKGGHGGSSWAERNGMQMMLGSGISAGELVTTQGVGDDVGHCMMTPNAAIPGHNHETLKGQTVSSCTAVCRKHIWCKSFDFHRSDGTCYLSDKTSRDVDLKRDYPGNPYDHYDCEAGSTDGSYVRISRGCVSGHNMVKFDGKTVQECAALCDAHEQCKAFEYGMAYGGKGYQPQDCQLQDSDDAHGCNGGAYNLDLYVKKAPHLVDVGATALCHNTIIKPGWGIDGTCRKSFTPSTTSTTTPISTTSMTPSISTSSTGSTTSTTTSISTSISTTSASGMGIQSGDTIFLKSRSGHGKHIDVEGGAVQARWKSQGSFQALVIEKENGGNVNSGDTVYLKTHTNVHIDVQDQVAQARWHDHGTYQAMVIEKRTGNGVILPGDVVCIKAHTGKHLDVEDADVQARWNDCGDLQSMKIEKETVGSLFSGDSIHLLTHTGNRIEVEGVSVSARWSETGLWQTFTIENYGGRAILSGDAVFIKAHTGALVHVEDTSVLAKWNEHGAWQTFIMQKKGGDGPVMPGDAIYLRAHTGKFLEVEGVAVEARWFEAAAWQTLVVEKAAQRRLTEVLQANIIV